MIRSLVLVLALAVPAVADAGAKIGAVSRAEGACHGTLDGRSERLRPAADIFLDHEVRTEAAARLEITFDDATKLLLGEKAELTVDRFVYNPGKRSRFLLSVTGAMRFISGRDKPADSESVIRTPVADIGVRGTDFWTGPIDGRFGVLLLSGEVVVQTPAGEAVLDEPGEGVNIAAPGEAPGPVTQWPEDKVRRALASVAFR